MNVVTHAQFSTDPVVESVIIDLPRVSSRVSLGLLVVRLTVVAGGNHTWLINVMNTGKLCKAVCRLCKSNTQHWPSDGNSLQPYDPYLLKIPNPYCMLCCIILCHCSSIQHMLANDTIPLFC